jgi:diguanylate cyclase (GGDEF)-like protein/PAS domain S-box-containing protein
MHPLLKRQIKRYLTDDNLKADIPEEVRQLLGAISETYELMDRERHFFEHVIELNSSELNEKNRQLNRTLRSLNTAQRITHTGSWTLNLNSQEISVSDQLYQVLHLDKQQPLSLQYLQHGIHIKDRPLADTSLAETLANGNFDALYRLQLANGEIRYIQEHREVEYNRHNQPAIVNGSLQDVTRQKQAEQELSLFADVFHKSAEGIALMNEHMHLVAANDAWLKMTGFSVADLPLLDTQSLLDESNPQGLAHTISKTLTIRGFWQGEIIGKRKDGSSYPQLVSVSVSSSDADFPHHFIVNVIDITELKETEQKIRHLAHHDPLTGLVNRINLEEQLAFAMTSAKRHGYKLALMYIDMDQFKSINDTLGHAAGDNLLIEVGKRLLSSVRDSDIVARIGGDEFIVVFTGIREDNAAAPLARFLVEKLRQPYQFEENTINSSPSIGVSVYPKDGEHHDALLRAADAAMYHAKQSGRNQFRFYSEYLQHAWPHLETTPQQE